MVETKPNLSFINCLSVIRRLFHSKTKLVKARNGIQQQVITEDEKHLDVYLVK